jgi:hypothetical protein
MVVRIEKILLHSAPGDPRVSDKRLWRPSRRSRRGVEVMLEEIWQQCGSSRNRTEPNRIGNALGAQPLFRLK